MSNEYFMSVAAKFELKIYELPQKKDCIFCAVNI